MQILFLSLSPPVHVHLGTTERKVAENHLPYTFCRLLKLRFSLHFGSAPLITLIHSVLCIMLHEALKTETEREEEKMLKLRANTRTTVCMIIGNSCIMSSDIPKAKFLNTSLIVIVSPSGDFTNTHGN